MSSLQNIGKGALRVAKNYTKGYSDTQAKVRDATSNDPWGPSGTQMNEIAQMTYNQNDFVEIMEMLDKRLNDKGKNWRHVFKSLTLLDYCLHAGSENVVIYFRDNLYVIKTLREFQFVDEFGKDQGANVRQKAKDIVNLLQDEARLRQERQSRAHMRDRMVSGRREFDEDNENENVRRRSQSAPPRRRGGMTEEEQLRRAIEESKKTAAQEQSRSGGMTAEDRDLAQAIKLSEEDEKNRNKAVEDANASALFDDNNQLPPQQQGGFGLIDPSAYTVGLQPQFTAIQPQFTSFNPYQQQAQQEAMQQEYLRQQQEWMMQQQQQQEMLAQQQQQQLFAQQQQAQQEEWMRQQMLQQQQQQQQQQFLQQQQLMAQPTGFGTNNPFAAGFGTQSPQLPQNNSFQNNFNLPGTFANQGNQNPTPQLTISSPSVPTPGPSSAPARQTRADQENAHLANLLANRDDGMDTFGNTGALRYGHTASGLRLAAQATGNNPFARQQQQQQQQRPDQPFFEI